MMGMRDRTNSRKVEHLAVFARDPDVDRNGGYFDRIRLTHRALPELRLADIDPSTHFLGKRISFPLLISSMTGGDHALVRTINQRLAEAAEAEGVALAVGSQRVQFTHPNAARSFELRRFAPSIPLCANLGAVQLNKGFGLREARTAVETLDADGLYLHLNPLQEAVQPEGDTDFRGLTAKIAALSRALHVPVLVKEVGAGLSRVDADRLVRAGIRHLDVAGSGGTSWSRVEAHRHAPGAEDSLGLEFQDWGIPTPLALQQLNGLRRRGVYLIASGGIRSGLDMVKAMILGASICGMAAPFLGPARKSVGAVREAIARIRRAYVTGLFLLGQPDSQCLIGRTDLIETSPWS